MVSAETAIVSNKRALAHFPRCTVAGRLNCLLGYHRYRLARPTGRLGFMLWCSRCSLRLEFPVAPAASRWSRDECFACLNPTTATRRRA